MNNKNNDYDTWVYHALYKPKKVKFSEAKLLYKKGWRDTYDPKELFKGFRGKWYKFIIYSRSFIKYIKTHWNSYKILIVLLMLIGIIIGIINLLINK